MEIKYYSTNIGNFFQVVPNGYVSSLGSYNIVEVNGVPVGEIQNNNGWYFLDKELKDFKQRKPGGFKRIGYRLDNQRLASDVLPSFIPDDEIESEYNYDDERDVWTGKYEGLQGYYSEVTERIDTTVETIEVKLTKIRELQIADYSKPQEMKISYISDGSWGKQEITDLAKIAVFDDIERMLTPEFLLHTRPCSLTSKQVYGIVRDYILKNIDGKYARVTSNYDFCFTVKKLVSTKPYTVRREKFTPRGNSYKPPKFYNEPKAHKEVQIFEMTWAGYKGIAGYDGYTCIDPWSANNLKELYDNMNTYLKELMLTINAPAEECSHCNGVGMLVHSVKTNERG